MNYTVRGKRSLGESVNQGFGFGCGCLLLILLVVIGIPAALVTCSVVAVQQADQDIKREKHEEQRSVQREQTQRVIEQQRHERAIADASEQILGSLQNGMSLGEVEEITGTNPSSRIGSEDLRMTCKWTLPDSREMTVTFDRGHVTTWTVK